MRGSCTASQHLAKRRDPQVALSDGLPPRPGRGRPPTCSRPTAARASGHAAPRSRRPCVRRRSSSTMSAPERHRRGEGRQGVLPLAHGLAPVGDGDGASLWVDVARPRTLCRRRKARQRAFRPPLWPVRRIVVSGAPEERAGEHDRHHALQHSRQHQRQPQPTDRRQAPGRERAHRRSAPHEAAPGTAHSSHEMGGSQPLAERDRDDGDDGDRDTHEAKAGAAKTQLFAEAMIR